MYSCVSKDFKIPFQYRIPKNTPFAVDSLDLSGHAPRRLHPAQPAQIHRPPTSHRPLSCPDTLQFLATDPNHSYQLQLDSVVYTRQFALSRENNDDGIIDDEEARNAIESAAAKTAAVTRSSDLLGNVSAVWADLVKSTLMMPNDGGLDNSAAYSSSMERALVHTAKRLGVRHPKLRGQDQIT